MELAFLLPSSATATNDEVCLAAARVAVLLAEVVSLRLARCQRTSMSIPELASALRSEVSLLFKRLRQQTASAQHLSLTETTTLSLLQQHGSLLASELAGMVNITPPSMSQVLQHLLALAYIDRKPSATDKRKHHIQLTEAGRAVVATARNERDVWLAAAMEACLSAEEQQVLAAAVPLLQRLHLCDPPTKEI